MAWHQIAAAQPGHQNFGTDMDLYEAGLDSMGSIMLLSSIYDQTKLSMTLDDLVNYEESQNLLPIGPKGKYIFGTVTIGEKGQIVIPVKARKIFGLQPGDDLVMLGDIDQGLALIKAQSLLETILEREGSPS